ncbi:hypothetical protein J2736_003228 [Paenibacillus qinlingensis]|uniref:Uncharacterized protein n=1 Tax=Paenibacillus qinlingensis TaxID=1837343 RepID=A0ABU1NX21_9BACL|nr:hypothetical protein [Paenibacillus qinlingensis]
MAGSTINEPGAAPNVHCSIAPPHTRFPIVAAPSLKNYFPCNIRQISLISFFYTTRKGYKRQSNPIFDYFRYFSLKNGCESRRDIVL